MNLWKKAAVSAAAVTTLGLGFAGPVQAASTATAVRGSLGTAATTSHAVTPHTVVRIDRFAPHSTYVIADYDSVSGGIDLFRHDLHGTQRCFGRAQGAFYVNHRLAAVTGIGTFNRGQRLTAHFDSHGSFYRIGTVLTWQWRGSCAPASGEQVTVVRA